MSEGIILPGDVTPEAMAKIAAGKEPTPELRAASAAAEQREIVAEIESVMLTELAPYKDDAPVCDAMAELQSVAKETTYHKIVQMPAWAHGRCIGAACGRFKQTPLGPICGRALQDLAAMKELGLMDRDGSDPEHVVAAELARWAYPSKPEQAEA